MLAPFLAWLYIVAYAAVHLAVYGCTCLNLVIYGCIWWYIYIYGCIAAAAAAAAAQHDYTVKSALSSVEAYGGGLLAPPLRFN